MFEKDYFYSLGVRLVWISGTPNDRSFRESCY